MEEIYQKLKDICKKKNIKVIDDKIVIKALIAKYNIIIYGAFALHTNTIVIDKRTNLITKIITLAHEMAHEIYKIEDEAKAWSKGKTIIKTLKISKKHKNLLIRWLDISKKPCLDTYEKWLPVRNLDSCKIKQAYNNFLEYNNPKYLK